MIDMQATMQPQCLSLVVLIGGDFRSGDTTTESEKTPVASVLVLWMFGGGRHWALAVPLASVLANGLSTIGLGGQGHSVFDGVVDRR
jgi:hypothetical protein